MDTSTLEQILDFLCNELGGDWFIAGGSLVRLDFDAERGTEDLDLLRIRHPQLSDEASRNALFQWLMKRGLGPEWVNNAMEPFVREVTGWETELIPFRQGKRGAVFRPNLTLFVYLKLRRATEVDLLDIQKAVPSWASPIMKERLKTHRTRLGLGP